MASFFLNLQGKMSDQISKHGRTILGEGPCLVR